MRCRECASLPLAVGFVADGAATNDKVKQAGSVTCGVQTGTPGFGQPDSQGKFSGFNIDICRAISAALFGDPGQGQICAADGAAAVHRAAIGRGRPPVEQHDRTLPRDTQLGLNFAPGRVL